MFYYYLRFFNWVSSVFGLYKPFCYGKNKETTRWFSLWSFIVSALFIASYFYPNDFWSDIKIKIHLEEISNANNLIVNLIIILDNMRYCGRVYRQIYAIINSTLLNLQITKQNQKLLAIKLYLWMVLPLSVFTVLIVLEFIYANGPYTLIVKMPIFLSILHLFIHLSVLLAALKVINIRIFEISPLNNNFLLENSSKGKSILQYVFFSKIQFYEINFRKQQINLHLLCKVYDELSICITLMEQSHGIQILLSVWLMFSNAVTGITLITIERANMAWVVIVRSTLPLLWYFMGSYVANQLRREVERTDLLIVKQLIDFRCDPATREVLQTFKQVVGANRLEFTACHLFRLDYATILGTVVNVITYSIILIQVL